MQKHTMKSHLIFFKKKVVCFRDFIALRWIDMDGTLPTGKTVGDLIFDKMQVLYHSGLDYFKDGPLAPDGNPMIADADDDFNNFTKCYHSRYVQKFIATGQGAHHCYFDFFPQDERPEL